MADQQTRVSLIFEANASQAKNEINSLVQSLQKIQSMPRSLIDPTGIKEASKAAMELQGHIQKAINVDTGKLDLSRFATSLSSSGKDLGHFRDVLTRIGPEGNAAFQGVLRGINNAEVSTVRLTKGMRDFLTTMKNTAKWQISSSIMHGFIGGLQSAWSYAQSLDRSLNNIRIVTGQTSDEMARFAVEANKAAQSLSTTTTKYTDAALIFYQQGLGDKAVKERTETVIKMANVTGEAAKDVSSYMTAIWNNFADGTKSLDYYADVITKLGAATAASSEEIAGGLEKFAAIGSTIGLSYEYATSMITTIVDKTRQSEDVVGTALKTILARVQGLNLGETLEDGTTLNKYSQALADVGVNIKDASGQLKDMDVILDDLGSKWSTFDRATQTALAQVVGGVRQYNQIISLMNNWDSFKGNVDLARSSTGSLNEQADIYAESWEAARNRVTAAAQGIYDALINEDVFIKLDDIFTHLLQGVGGVVKGMGGMVPILSTIGGLITTKFAKEMPVALKNMSQNFAVLSGRANKEALILQKDTTTKATEGISNANTTAEAVQYDSLRRVSLMREELIKNQHRMNSEEVAQYEMAIRNEQTLGDINVKRAEALDLTIRQTQALKEQLSAETALKEKKNFEEGYDGRKVSGQKTGKYEEIWNKTADKRLKQQYDDLDKLAEYETRVQSGGKLTAIEERDRFLRSGRMDRVYSGQMYQDVDAEAQKIYQEKLNRAVGHFVDTGTQLEETKVKLQDLNTLMQNNSIDEYVGNMEGLKAKATEIQTAFSEVGISTQNFDAALADLGNDAIDEKTRIDNLKKALQELSVQAGSSTTNLNNKLSGMERQLKELGLEQSEIDQLKKLSSTQGKGNALVYGQGDIEKIQKKQVKASEVLTSSMGALMSVYGAVNAVTSAHAVLQNKDATAMEKTGAVVGALTSSMAALNSVLSLVKLGPWGIAAAVAAAGIAALVIAISNYETEEEKRIKKLEKKAEGLKSTYEALKTKVEETAQAFENYDQAVEALNECTSGTQEWYQALVNVNQMADAILAKSPELAQYARWDENGMLYWAEGAQEYIQQQSRTSDMIYAAQQIAQAEYDTAVDRTKNYDEEALAQIRQYEISEGIDFTNRKFVTTNQADYDIVSNFLEAIFEAFGDETEQAVKYIRDIGLGAFLGMDGKIKNYEEELGMNIHGSYVTNAVEVSNVKSAGDYIKTYDERFTADARVRNAMNGMLGGTEDYDVNNAAVYSAVYQKALEEAITTVSTTFSTGEQRASQYGAITNSKVTYKDGKYTDADGKEILEEVVLEALGAEHLSKETGYLDRLVDEGNAIVENATDYGRSILRSGFLGSAHGEIGHKFKRAETFSIPEVSFDSTAGGIKDEIKTWDTKRSSFLDADKYIKAIDAEEAIDGIELKEGEAPSSEALVQAEQAFMDGWARIEELEQEKLEISGNRETLLGKIALAQNSHDLALDGVKSLQDEATTLTEENASLAEELDTILAPDETLEGLWTIVEDSQKSLDTTQQIYDTYYTGALYENKEFTDALAELGQINSDREAAEKELQDQRIAEYGKDKFFTTFWGEELTPDVAQGITSDIASQMVSSGVHTLGELWRLEEGDVGYEYADYTIEDLDALMNPYNYQGGSEAIAALESKIQGYNDREAEILESVYGANGIIEQEKGNLEEQIDSLETTVKESSDKIAAYNKKLYEKGISDEELATIEEALAEEEMILTQARIELSGLIHQRNLLDNQLKDIDEEIASIDIEGLETSMNEAQADYDLQTDLVKQQKYWDTVVADLEELGITVPEGIKTLSEGFQLDQALSNAQLLIDNAIAEADSTLISLGEDSELFYKNFLTDYFTGVSGGLNKFLSINAEMFEGLTFEEIAKKIFEEQDSPESIAAQAFQARDFLEGFGIKTDGLDDATVVKQANEISARHSIVGQLAGENEAKTYDITTDEGWKEFLESGYGEVIFGAGWEELESSQTSALALQEKLIKDNEKSQARAVDEWNKQFGEGKAYSAILGQNGEGETGIISGSKTMEALEGTHASVQEVSDMAKILGNASHRLDTDSFKGLDGVIGDLINSSGDATPVITTLNEVMGRIQTTGENISVEEVIKAFNEAGINLTALGIDADSLTNAINGTIATVDRAIGAFESFSNTIAGIMDVLSELQTGDEIDAEAWEQIKDIVEQIGYSDLFYTNAHGGKTYVGTAEQQQEIEQASLNQAAMDYVTSVKAVEDTVSGDYFKTSAYLTGDDATLQQTQQWMLGLGQMGYGAEALTQLVTGLGFNEMYAQRENLVDEEGNWTEIGAQVANAVFQALSGNYTDPEQVSQILATSGASRDTVNQWNGQGLFASDSDYQYAASQAIIGEYGNFGISPEEIQERIEYLEKYGDTAGKSASEITELAAAELRFEKGVENGKQHIEEWSKTLKKADKTADDWEDTITGIEEVYEDLFNIKPGKLSKEFVESAENAERLEKALNGSTEDMKYLQKSAADDLFDGEEVRNQLDFEKMAGESDEGPRIYLKMGVDEESWDSTLDTVEGYIDQMNNQTITPEIALDGINSALDDLVFNSEQAAIDASEGLSAMGVDADLIEHVVHKDGSHYTKTAQGNWFKIGKDGVAEEQPISAEIVMQEGEETQRYFTLQGKNFNGGVNRRVSKPTSRGGGGGGGGGGSRKPRAEKKQASDKQRYHTVTNQLEDLTDAYDKVSKAADRAFGKSRVKLLREQQGALKDLAATQRDYLDEIDSYLKQDRSNLDQVSQYVGFDVQLDENGTITNFDAIQDAMWDEYNSHINDKDEVTDMDEEAWKEYEEEWERIMSLIEQYEETQDLRKEALQQLQDYINEIYDLQLEEITYAVEVDIDASDDALEILDYLLSRIEDDAWKAAEAITYMGEQAAIMLDKNNTYTSGIQDILMNHTKDIRDSEGRLLQKAQLTEADVEGFMSGGPEAINKLMGMNDAFTDEEIQKLREYHGSLIEMNETLVELREGVFDKVLDSFGQFNEEMDKSINKIDHLSAVTDNYKNIIDIVGKKNLNVSNALLDSLNQASTEQRINRVEATRTKRDTIAAEITTAEAALADARAKGLEEDAKLWEKTLEEMRDSLDEAEEDFMQSWEDALDGIRQQFEEAVGHAVETLSDALAGPLMGSMEELQDAFDRQNTVAERYLPDYEKIYELNKLNRDITNSIDETDNIKAKQELAALQAEINALEESEAQISEYQMENLRRRYELKQAEIALTEAQDAKSQVQMSRDADGNWSYVYTANEDQVAEAEQTYEDRLFAMQEANAEYINAMNDSIIQLQAEMTQKIEEIMMDETLSAEEKMARVQEVTTFYQEQMNYYMDELELVLGENQVLYEEDWAKYSELTGYKISANEDYVDNFNETALSTLTGFQTMEEYQQNFNDAIGHPDSHGLLYDLSQAYETWKNNTEAAMEAAGTSIHNFADDMAEDVDNIVDASEKATEEIEKMGEKVEQTFTDLTTAVQNWSNEYSATIDAILEKNTALAESFNKILQSYSDYKEATSEDAPAAPEEEPEENTDTGEPADEGANVSDSVAEKTEKYKKGIAFAIWSHPSSGWGTGNSSRNLTSGTRYDRLKSKGLDPNTVQQQINAYRGKSTDFMKKDSGISFSKWSDRVGALNPYTYKKFAFDTGGYTGDWGEEGRWALLHSKEIVLNKDDTANLLSAVDMIRQISKAIDLNAYSSAGYGNSIIKAGNGMGGTLEQNVHITAEFPNATNREEIYSAFTDIINLASQYANRK